MATAHTVARLMYHLRQYRHDYGDPGADDDEEQYRDRAIRTLQRTARQLGLALVPIPA